MKNEDKWRPTKFAKQGENWIANRDEVDPGSWLVTDLVAGAYGRAIAQHCQGRVIDVGCGSAPLYGMYRERASSITCIDWDNSLHDVSFCDSYVDLNRAWDVPSASFDTVISTDVLEHLYNPEIFFSEVSRICAPGGKVVIGVPFMYWVHEAPHDYLRHTEFSLRRFCQLNALEVVELSSNGGAPELMMDIAFKIVRPRKSIAKPLYGLAKSLLRCPPVPRISKRTKSLFPIGYVLVAKKGA